MTPDHQVDQLTRLTETEFSSTLRPMPRIVERAGELRRGRRLLRLGQAGGAATLVALVAVTGVQLFGGSDQAMPASGGSYGCTTGYAYVEKLTALRDLVYLPSASTTGPLTGPVLSRRETSDCAFAPPQAVAYSLTGSGPAATVTKRLEIGAAGALDRYDLPGVDGHFAGTVTHPVIGGQPSNLYGMDGSEMERTGEIQPQSWLYLYWTGADGISRSLSSDGLTRAELVAVAQGLQFDGTGTADTTTLPEGFTSWAELAPLPDTPKADREYRYVEFSFKGSADTPGWSLNVRDRPEYNDASYGGQPVQVGSADGWWVSDGAGGGNKGQGRLTWRVDGVQFTLSGNATSLGLEQALAVARSVTKASPEDPRIEAAGVV